MPGGLRVCGHQYAYSVSDVNARPGEDVGAQDKVLSFIVGGLHFSFPAVRKGGSYVDKRSRQVAVGVAREGGVVSGLDPSTSGLLYENVSGQNNS